MKKYFKQFTAGTSGDNFYQLISNSSGKQVLILSHKFTKPLDIDIKRAYLTIPVAILKSIEALYWDKSGSISNYDNLDANSNAEKISGSSNLYYNNFEITKPIRTMLDNGTLSSVNERFIFILPAGTYSSSIEASITIEYDSKRGYRKNLAAVPFEYQNLSGSINLGRKSLGFEVPITKGFGFMPLALSFVYNSEMYDYRERVFLDNGSAKYINYFCGTGFKLNFQQFLVVDKATTGQFMSDGESIAYYTWINSMGNRIHFAEKLYAEINEKKVYLKENQLIDNGTKYACNGVNYDVERIIECDNLFNLVVVNVADTLTYEISDNEGNKLIFEQSEDAIIYRIKKLKDKFDHEVVYNYDPEEYYIVSVESRRVVSDNETELVNSLTFNYGNMLIEKVTEYIVGGENLEYTIETKDNLILTDILSPNNMDDYHFGYSTFENGGHNKYYIQTMFGSNGSGYQALCTDCEYEELFLIQNTDGLQDVIQEDGQTIVKEVIPLDTTKGWIDTIDGVTFRKKRLIDIDYGYPNLYCIRVINESTEESVIYTLNGLRECSTYYEEKYDGVKKGTPQARTFVKNGDCLSQSFENKCIYLDNLEGSSSTSTTLENISLLSDENTFPISNFVYAVNATETADKKVYCGNKDNFPKISVAQDMINFFTLDANSNGVVVSAWAKANSYPTFNYAKGILKDSDEDVNFETDLLKNSPNFFRKFNLCVKVKIKDIEQNVTEKIFSNSYDCNNTDFQYCSVYVALNPNDWLYVESVDVYIDYENNNGPVYMYGVSANECLYDFAKYNAKGICEASFSHENLALTGYVINSNNLVSSQFTTLMSNLSNEFSRTVFEYDNKKNIIKERTTTHKGSGEQATVQTIVNEYVYSNDGQVVESKTYNLADVENGTPTKMLYSKAEYGNYGEIKKTFNEFGELVDTIQYRDGSIEQISNALNEKIKYYYDDSRNFVTKIQADFIQKPCSNSQFGINNNVIQFINGLATEANDKVVVNPETDIYSGNNIVCYSYDGLGRVVEIKVNKNPYCSIEYFDDNTVITTYANGQQIKIYYDKEDRECLVYSKTTSQSSWGSTLIEFKVDAYGNPKDLVDEIGGGTKYAWKDVKDEDIQKTVVSNEDDHFYDFVHKYKKDENNRVVEQVYEHNNVNIDETKNNFNDDFSLDSIEHTAIGKEGLIYDNLNRIEKLYKLDGIRERVYTYKTVGNKTSSLIETDAHNKRSVVDEEIVTTCEDCFKYTYDNLGRIILIEKLSLANNSYMHSASFEYDYLGRLVRENISDFGATYVYEYDNAGNILYKHNYLFTNKEQSVSLNQLRSTEYYGYSNGKLTSHTDVGYITYDNIGNPLNYGSATLTWSHVNRLRTYSRAGLNCSYDYNYAGIRTAKIVDGVKTKFAIDGSNIIAQQKADGSDKILFYYGLDGVTAFKHNDSVYYYQKNILGDIIGVYNDAGDVVARYTYDAWGNHKVLNPNGTVNTLSTFIGNINPFRYRSYYFDIEIGYYYLQSRYYDPQIGRFISPDDISYLDSSTVNGLNLYAYCNNNPVMYSDPSGHSFTLAFILIGSFAVGFASSLFVNAAQNDWQLDWKDVAQAGIDGLFATGSTLLAMTGIGFWASVGIGAAMGWSQYALGSAIQGDALTLSGSMTAIGFGALGGALSGAGAANTRNIAKNLVGLSDDGSRAIGAIATAYNRRLTGQISQKGFQGVVNLYGKTAFNAVKAAVPGTKKMLFMQAARKIVIYTPIANIASGGLNSGYRAWGWI